MGSAISHRHHYQPDDMRMRLAAAAEARRHRMTVHKALVATAALRACLATDGLDPAGRMAMEGACVALAPYACN
jgi:hypothetical protein